MFLEIKILFSISLASKVHVLMIVDDNMLDSTHWVTWIIHRNVVILQCFLVCDVSIWILIIWFFLTLWKLDQPYGENLLYTKFKNWAFNKSRMNYSTRLASLKYILKETER